jgi:hypothetical protein
MEKRFIAGVLIVVMLGTVMFFFYNRALNYEEEIGMQKRMDSLIAMLDNKLSETLNVALSLTLVLSKNPHIMQCILKKNENLCAEYLPEFEHIMKKYEIFKNMTINLHLKDTEDFIRLSSHNKTIKEKSPAIRSSLKKAQETKEPVQGIEIWEFGIFERVVVPVFDKNVYAGAIETVVFPEAYTEFFKNLGVDLYILMKNSYLPASGKAHYPKKLILKNYTIINQETNNLDFIKDIEFSGTGYLKYDEKYVLHTPIIDINGNEVGYYVFSWMES